MMSLLPVAEELRSRAADCLCVLRTGDLRNAAKRPRLVGIIFAVTLGTAALQASGPCAYLSAVGPAPLRFAAANGNPTALAPTWFAPKTNSVENTNNVVPQIGISTNAGPMAETIAPPVKPQSATVATMVPIQTTDVPAPENNFMAPWSSGDSMTVMPQMLAEFMRPAPGGTNQVSMYVPLDVKFTPPMSQGESRAIYKSN